MPEQTIEDWSAYEIIKELGEDLDFMINAESLNWKCYFTQRAYDTVKADLDYIYEKDGQEYVKVYDNHVIPFRIHMRIAGIDESILDDEPYSSGCRREIDD